MGRLRESQLLSHPFHKTIHHALLAGLVELDGQLVAVHGGDVAVAEFLMKHAVADREGGRVGSAFGARPGTHTSRNTGTSKGRFAARREPLTIEGELVAKSTGVSSAFRAGDRVFHIKFGNGNVTAVDGNKLTIAFDKAGEKRVVDSFVEKV